MEGIWFMTNIFKYLFYPKKNLVKRINELERNVENLKHSHKVLREDLENLKKYNKDVIDNINSMVFGKPSVKQDDADILKKQNDTFKEQANVYDWGD